MEKIYCDGVCNPTAKEATDFLVKLYDAYAEAKERLDEDRYKSFVFNHNNYIREALNLPNKVFSIVKSLDNTWAQIATFPKEPDGNYYEGGYDEELKNFYILVDHIKE